MDQNSLIMHGQTSLATTPSARYPSTVNGYRRPQVRLRSLEDLGESFLEEWRELEKHSTHRNPFQSPGYVLAAARHLPGVQQPLVCTVEQQGVLQGLFVLEAVSWSRRLPLRHLRAWQTPHTYLDAPLLRADRAEAALDLFWNFLTHGDHEWHGVEFSRFPHAEAMTDLFDRTAHDQGITCLQGRVWERACLNLHSGTAQESTQFLTLKRLKSLRRGWRELEKQGDVRFEIVNDPHRTADCAEEFMRLESLGWKSSVGTAIASSLEHQRFFREMITQFNAREEVFFTRLLINEEAVASVVHLKSGNAAYAFKLGWNPAMERGCPGFQLKLKTAMHAAEQLPELQLVDSCSSPGSFIERVWPHRRKFCNRVYVSSPVGQLASSMVSSLRWVRDKSVEMSRHLFCLDARTQGTGCVNASSRSSSIGKGS